MRERLPIWVRSDFYSLFCTDQFCGFQSQVSQSFANNDRSLILGGRRVENMRQFMQRDPLAAWL